MIRMYLSLGGFILLLLGVIVSLATAIPVVRSNDERLNVFIVPHSHCDPGWLKSVQEYFEDDVKSILDTVVAELIANPKRKFSWVEQAFFSRWWDRASETQKQHVRSLVAENRLEFNLGGWVMSDEATTTYNAVIDQLTEGHEYLKNILDVKPKVAWHIDPFGHSTFTPEVFALAGFDAWVGNRILYRLKDDFKATKHMEFIWEGEQPVAGKPSRMFTHILDSHYSAPSGFDFEGFPWSSPPPPVTPANVADQVDELLGILQDRASWFKTRHLLVPLGDDFKFKNATRQFVSWDRIIDYVASHPELGVDMQYAVLSDYVAAVHKEDVEWPLFHGDFLSYADDMHSFWTGFYTSRPAIKRQVRLGAAQQRAIEMVHAAAPAAPTNQSAAFESIQANRRALALTQHHDGVTGTEKAAVVEDYQGRMQSALANATSVAAEAISRVMKATSATSSPVSLSLDPRALEEVSDGQVVPAIVFNSAAWSVSTIVELPAPSCDWRVKTVDGTLVPSQITIVDGQATLAFVADNLPAVGATTFLIVPDVSADCTEPQFLAAGQGATISNGHLELEIDAKTHRPTQLTHINSSDSSKFAVDLLEYKSLGFQLPYEVTHCPFYNDTNSLCPPPNSQSSGAYIFRPSGPASPVSTDSVPAAVVRGDVFEEVVLDYGSSRSATFRLARVSGILQSVVMVRHDIALEDRNREVIMRVSTDLATNSSFHTDDSALRWVKRTRNADTGEPIAANYYPMEVMAGIEGSDASVMVFADRTHGFSSLNDGDFEVMLHRRCSTDDGRGLSEALDDKDTVSPMLWIALAPESSALQIRHTLAVIAQAEPVVFYATNPIALSAASSDLRSSRSLLRVELPANVHLLTLATRNADPSELVVRLQHLYEAVAPNGLGEDVQIDLISLLAADLGDVLSVEERTLTLEWAVSALNDRLQWKIQGEEPRVNEKASEIVADGSSITLAPLEIRTFVAKFSPKTL